MSQTQRNRLLDYLKFYGKINPMQAWSVLGIYRLGARIFELRKQGHKIVSKDLPIKNRWNEDCRVAEYHLDTKSITEI